MGDAEEMVQKALSWAIREWTRVDPEGAAGLLDDRGRPLAVAGADGARAWVIRDALAGQPPQLQASAPVAPGRAAPRSPRPVDEPRGRAGRPLRPILRRP